MTLLETIQQSAVDSGTPLSTLLRQCRLLAARIDSQMLEEWVIWESDGYPEASGVPSYRVWPVEVKAHFAGPFQSQVRNYTVPPALLPENVREQCENFHCRMSIATLEASLAETKGEVHVVLPNLALILGGKVLDGYTCIDAWGSFGSLHLVQVINAVRNRVLELAIRISRESPLAGDPQQSSQTLIPPATVSTIVNTTIYGGTQTIVGSAPFSTFAINVVAGDWSSLKNALGEQGIDEDDLAELERALDEDGQPSKNDSFGPRVSGWLASMGKKAASGAWELGLTVGTRVLSEAILKYYGLTP